MGMACIRVNRPERGLASIKVNRSEGDFFFFFFFFFFLFEFYDPFKKIFHLYQTDHSSKVGKNRRTQGKNHLTIRKQNLAFPHVT